MHATALGIVAAIQLVPILVQTGFSLGAVLSDLMGGVMLIGVVALLVAHLLLRDPATLEISESGLQFTARRSAFAFRWSDIGRVSSDPKGVNLVPIPNPGSRVGPCLVPASFGLSPEQLFAICSACVERFGVAGATLASDTSLSAPITTYGGKADQGQRLTLFGVGAAAVAAIAVLSALKDYVIAVDLQAHGRETWAAVERFYDADCGRSGCKLMAQYSFTPTGADHRVRGWGELGYSRDKDDSYVRFAKSQGRVPIVYDSRFPSISALNFSNIVFRQDPADAFSSGVGFLVVFGGFLAAVAGVLVFAQTRST